LLDKLRIGDVALNEVEPRIVTHLIKVRHVSGVGQQVEAKHLISGLLVQDVPHVCGTDETGGAGDQNTH
jgi:hypothetical protein